MSLWIKQKWFHVNFFSVVNDFDEETERKISVEHREEYLAKVAHRVQNYEVKILNELRKNKKLLVLDIDYTLFDHKRQLKPVPNTWDPIFTIFSLLPIK